ncbi:MAG: MATE family efflux transporter [Cyanobacteria bacterium P01_G01_bin.54]
MTSKLTEGPIGLQLLKLTLPLVGGVFAVLAFSLADIYFVAQLGTNELAAMSFAFPVVMVLSNIAIGLGVGASSIIARAIGAGDRYRVQRLTTDSLTLSLLVVAIFVGLGLTTIKPLFTALGAAPNVLPLIQDYMDIWYLGMIVLVVPLVGNSAIRASGNTVVPSLIMTIAAVINIGLDPVLIFGWGGFPVLGIKGAALATVISRAVTLVASLAFLHFREHLLLFARPKLKTVWQSWQSILSVGLPAAGANLIVPISIGIITSLMARYGSEAVAGFGIASQVEFFALIPPFALSASIGPFVGQNWGANQHSRVNRSLRLSFWFCLAWGGLIAIILGATASRIAAWFDGEPTVIASASAYLMTVPLSYGALGIILIFSATLNALGKPLPSIAIVFSRTLLLYVPLAYLGSWLFGIRGIFAAACLANVAVGLGVYVWYSYQNLFKAEVNSA